MKTILFQGDSITDAGRTAYEPSGLGRGYSLLVSAELGFENPGEYEFINRGISGNRIIDVLARVKCDIINLKPDIMSIMIGINDVWHEIKYNNGISKDNFRLYYSKLIEEVKSALPHIKIMIIEPYVLKGTATEEFLAEFQQGAKDMSEVAKEIAEKYGLAFVKTQEVFDKALALAPETYWTPDGVHPSANGHELIKREWIKTFKTL